VVRSEGDVERVEWAGLGEGREFGAGVVLCREGKGRWWIVWLVGYVVSHWEQEAARAWRVLSESCSVLSPETASKMV
jgi:hypothetical protein